MDVDYIMETFPIVKRRDVLEVYGATAEAIRTGKPYQTLVNPPPADSRASHKETRQAATTRGGR